MTRPAPSCFSEDNTRAEGFSGHQIYAQMHGGEGTGSAQLAATKAKELERSYAIVEDRLKKVGETLGEAWTGASADAAQAAANPIKQAMIQMQDALRQADHSISNQVYQFNHNKSQLKNMPEKKPETGFWDDVSPWDTDAEDAVNKYNSEESHNRKVYSEFQSASNTNRSELPKEFPGVMADTLNVEVIQNNGGGGDNTTNTSTIRNPTGTGSPNFPSSTGGPQGTGSTWTPPGSITGGNDNTTSQAVGGDVNSPLRNELPGPKPPIGNVIDRPPNAGIPPIGIPGGPGLSGPGGGAGRGPGGPGGGAGGGKFGGGGAGKFGGGGGLGGMGTGSGTSGTQPGGKAGVFGGMGESGPNAGGRGGAAGAAGRGGAAGMGGMGGQGAKGQGEEDGEHKMADYLVTEENTNEIIGDMPMVAPPTIGG
ncbi:hypothetical protein LFM09_41415 [Lentzea alba]|uniref:hypothetical protein n=1 Tax=Lentzea alba TaxID=2714351 RepID=UPI0039BF1836